MTFDQFFTQTPPLSPWLFPLFVSTFGHPGSPFECDPNVCASGQACDFSHSSRWYCLSRSTCYLRCLLGRKNPERHRHWQGVLFISYISSRNSHHDRDADQHGFIDMRYQDQEGRYAFRFHDRVSLQASRVLIPGLPQWFACLVVAPPDD